MTPRKLGVLTGQSSTQVLDVLEPFRSIVIVDEPYGPDSDLHFLHPTLRDALLHIGGLAAVPSEAEVAARLRIGCMRTILSPLLAVRPEIPLDYPAFSEYAQNHPPPAGTDIGDIQYAFDCMHALKEQDISGGEHSAFENDAEVALVERYANLDSRTVDDLFLWMCVTPLTDGGL